MAYCYVFIDESGNYDFSPTGTKTWVLTSIITEDIHPGVLELYDLKHKLIDLGTDIEYFHAAEDRQVVRDEVFKIISGLNNIRIDSLIVDKRKTGPSLREMARFYPEMVENLLKYPFDPRGIDIKKYEKVLIFFDRAATAEKQRKALVSAVKAYLPHHLGGIRYSISMHSSASHVYLQIVDYICWALARKWERGDFRSYNEIRRQVKSEFDIFRSGTTVWY